MTITTRTPPLPKWYWLANAYCEFVEVLQVSVFIFFYMLWRLRWPFTWIAIIYLLLVRHA
jgi:hypothetical protein